MQNGVLGLFVHCLYKTLIRKEIRWKKLKWFLLAGLISSLSTSPHYHYPYGGCRRVSPEQMAHPNPKME